MTPGRYIALLLLLAVAHSASAEQRPNWALELKGGRFDSAEARWSEFYGNDRYAVFALGLAYRVHSQIEIGAEAAYLRDEGQGFAPGHGELAGNVDYRAYPVHFHVTAVGLFRAEQWLVPYVGAGWTRFHYRIETDEQATVSGSTHGYQYRAGVRLLLDNLERSAAQRLEERFGIMNTHFFLEAQRIKADKAGTELGGTAYLGGLRFEY